MLQQLNSLFKLNEETRSAIRRTGGALAQAITITGLVLTYYSCDGKEVEQAGIGISFAGFALEYWIEYLENELERAALKKSHDLWDDLVVSNPNIARVEPSSSWFKMYGLSRNKWTIGATFFNVSCNAAGIAMAILNAATPKGPYRSAAIACSTISVGLHWLSQKLVNHNIKHETGLYEKANADIIEVKLLNKQMPPGNAVPTYKR